MDRAQLRTCLDTLDEAIPPLRGSSPTRAHFGAAFAHMAEAIRNGARTPADVEFVHRRLEEILSWHGLDDLLALDDRP